jgi:hypothetical protein
MTILNLRYPKNRQVHIGSLWAVRSTDFSLHRDRHLTPR